MRIGPVGEEALRPGDEHDRCRRGSGSTASCGMALAAARALLAPPLLPPRVATCLLVRPPSGRLRTLLFQDRADHRRRPPGSARSTAGAPDDPGETSSIPCWSVRATRCPRSASSSKRAGSRVAVAVVGADGDEARPRVECARRAPGSGRPSRGARPSPRRPAVRAPVASSASCASSPRSPRKIELMPRPSASTVRLPAFPVSCSRRTRSGAVAGRPEQPPRHRAELPAAARRAPARQERPRRRARPACARRTREPVAATIARFARDATPLTPPT